LFNGPKEIDNDPLTNELKCPSNRLLMTQYTEAKIAKLYHHLFMTFAVVGFEADREG
jgi:hypothetical protein